MHAPQVFLSHLHPRFSSGLSEEGNRAEADAAEAALLTDEESLLVTTRLHQVLRLFMLRRLKTTVAQDLPKKVCN